MARPTEQPRHDLGWLQLQLGALYVHDPAGRIVRFNEPPHPGDAAPFLFFGKTRLGNLWRLRAGLDDTLTRDLARLAAAEPVGERLEAVPERLHAMRSRIEAHHPVSTAFAGLAYHFVGADLQTTSEARRLSADEIVNAERVFPGLPQGLARRAPVVGVVADGAPVSVAFCATTPGDAREVGVETLVPQRGRGFAVNAVSRWAAEVVQRGVVPLYSTAFDNQASRAVARKLGLTPYASDWHFR